MDEYLKGITDRKPRPVTSVLAKAVNHAARQIMVQEIQELETRAHGLGMHVTGQALNRAKNALGWEMAGDMEQAGKAARDDRT
jgi:hypothetical protein